jgi:hypothetical protein
MSAKTVSRVGLVILAGTGLGLGLWATATPRGFYDDFPGFDRHWVSMDGPFNEHLLRDYGALNLALGVLAVCALVWLTRPLVIATAVAWIVYSVPHIVYHATHLDHYETGDQIGIIGGLVLAPIVAVVLLFSAARLGEHPAVETTPVG